MRAPIPARLSAATCPMPEVAPVMTMVLPSMVSFTALPAARRGLDSGSPAALHVVVQKLCGVARCLEGLARQLGSRGGVFSYRTEIHEPHVTLQRLAQLGQRGGVGDGAEFEKQ